MPQMRGGYEFMNYLTPLGAKIIAATCRRYMMLLHSSRDSLLPLDIYSHHAHSTPQRVAEYYILY